MLLRDNVWEAIREQFTEEERVELRKFVTGVSVCPRAFVVDAESIPNPLQSKLTTAIHNHAVETRRNQTGIKGSTR
jgi:hypothetical protein